MMSFAKRYFPGLAAAMLVVTALAFESAQTAPAQEQGAVSDVLSKDAVLRDADNPVLGNPKGDITIVEYFDYQCPYCKKLSPVLDQVIKDDKNVRLVLKDWPILGDPSGYAARLVLAAKYQNKYEAAHRALIVKVGRLTEAVIDEALTQAGVDVARAKAVLQPTRPRSMRCSSATARRRKSSAFTAHRLFWLGSFRVPGGLTAEQFKLAIADARKAAKDGAGK